MARCAEPTLARIGAPSATPSATPATPHLTRVHGPSRRPHSQGAPASRLAHASFHAGQPMPCWRAPESGAGRQPARTGADQPRVQHSAKQSVPRRLTEAPQPPRPEGAVESAPAPVDPGGAAKCSELAGAGVLKLPPPEIRPQFKRAGPLLNVLCRTAHGASGRRVQPPLHDRPRPGPRSLPPASPPQHAGDACPSFRGRPPHAEDGRQEPCAHRDSHGVGKKGAGATLAKGECEGTQPPARDGDSQHLLPSNRGGGAADDRPAQGRHRRRAMPTHAVAGCPGEVHASGAARARALVPHVKGPLARAARVGCGGIQAGGSPTEQRDA
eukprot:scaffold3819_cov107-Isochrysis_galbana.AAC.3